MGLRTVTNENLEKTGLTYDEEWNDMQKNESGLIQRIKKALLQCGLDDSDEENIKSIRVKISFGPSGRLETGCYSSIRDCVERTLVKGARI